jgi:hypothetical protein
VDLISGSGRSLNENRQIVERIWTLDCVTPPIPDDLTKVPGYGNPKAKFARTEIPAFMTIEASQVAEDGAISWTSQQLDFIRQELRRIYFDGYWFYNRTELVWLAPWQYLGLNYWKPALGTPDGFMEYRNRQRKILHFCWNVYQFCEEIGVDYLKGRQEGSTTWGHLIMFWLGSRAENQMVGLSSYDYELAANNFHELITTPVQNLPLWLTPVCKTNKGELIFEEPPERLTKTKKVRSISKALKGKIGLESLNPKGWDGRRLNGLMADEGGKWLKVVITLWWAKQVRALMEDGTKRGFAFLPTTTEEGDRGGEAFKNLFESSDISTLQNGKYRTTNNKLRNLFLPAYEGYPGWVDEYGNDIVEYPDDEQWEWMQWRYRHKERIGSKAKLLRDRQQALEAGNDALYAEELRQNPFVPADSFNSMNQHCPFDITVLQDLKRAADVPSVQEKIRRGYFFWLDEKQGVVGWREDKKGPIQRTWEPSAQFINRVSTKRSGKAPMNGKMGALGLDPYLKASTKNKGSKMAITGKLFYNAQYEEQNRKYREANGCDMPNYFPTPSIFLSYVHRSADPVEDMKQLLMAAIYYSMPVAPENNTLISVENYFNQMGYGDFLLNEAEMVNDSSPTIAQYQTKGIHTGGEGQGSDVVRKGATYFNDFLRGNALYLGDHTYTISEEPMRYPFIESINDNMLFDITDRTKSDATMSVVMVHFYEYNANEYSTPIFFVNKATSDAKRLFPKGTFLRKVN